MDVEGGFHWAMKSMSRKRRGLVLLPFLNCAVCTEFCFSESWESLCLETRGRRWRRWEVEAPRPPLPGPAAPSCGSEPEHPLQVSSAGAAAEGVAPGLPTLLGVVLCCFSLEPGVPREKEEEGRLPVVFQDGLLWRTSGVLLTGQMTCNYLPRLFEPGSS